MRTKDEILFGLSTTEGLVCEPSVGIEILNGRTEPYYWSDIVKIAMEEYAKPYKDIADIITRIFHYGHLVVETPREKQLIELLTQVGLWPTNEDEIIKRGEI